MPNQPASSKISIVTNGELKFTTYHYGYKNANDPIVLCLHGFPDNSDSFRYQVEDLVASGYQLVVPTLRGYETSSIPHDNDMSVDAIVGDVIACIDQLSIMKVHLVGHDWGAAIAYAVAAHAPERLLSLTTIAVPHPSRFAKEGIMGLPSQVLKSWYMVFNLIPKLSEYLYRRNDWRLVRFLWRRWSPNLEISDASWQNLKSTLEQPGVITAMLNYYRQNASILQLLGLKKTDTDSINKICVPNLVITGADDGCIDTRVFNYAILEEDYPAGYKIERIDGAGHFTHQEKPEVVNRLMIDWFELHGQ